MNLQEVIRVLEDFRLRPDIDGYCAISRTGIDPQYIQQALQTLLDLAEKIDKISNSGLVVEEKIVELREADFVKENEEWNACRQQQIKLISKNWTIARIEKIIKQTPLSEYQFTSKRDSVISYLSGDYCPHKLARYIHSDLMGGGG